MARALVAARNARFDVSGAEEYGEVVHVIEGKRRVSPLNADEVVGIIKRRLVELDYAPDRDFIVMTGSPILVALLYGEALHRAMHDAAMPGVRCLLFDAGNSRYLERVVGGRDDGLV